MLVSSKLKSRR